MKRYSIIINQYTHGKRLDVAISETVAHMGEELSRRKIRSIIDVGGVFLNKKRIRIASRTVQRGDKIEFEYDPRVLKKAALTSFELKKEDFLFFDQDVIAINKPPGLPAQETRSQSIMHAKTCLIKYFEKLGQKPPRIYLVHRLDKETSGVMIFATSPESSERLTNLFRGREIEKTYHALVYGIPKKNTFKVECQLSSIHPDTGLVRVLQSGGSSSETDFEVISSNKALNVALISCKPMTGRSHQIRVHLDHVGHPIIGDKKYGSKMMFKQLPEELSALTTDYHFLHAKSIKFPSKKNGESIFIEASYPHNFRKFVNIFSH